MELKILVKITHGGAKTNKVLAIRMIVFNMRYKLWSTFVWTKFNKFWNK